jgi:hypothetical protein
LHKRPADLSWRVLDRATDTLLTGSRRTIEGWDQQKRPPTEATP